MKQGLANPAVLAVLASKQGQEVLSNVNKAQSKGIDLAFTIIKVGIFFGVGYIVYKKVTGAFKKEKEDKRYAPANITNIGAKNKAENIYRAMYGVSSDFTKVYKNLEGLNRNGFTRVYNEFGNRRGADFKKLNMVEWFIDQFGDDDIARLRFLTKKAF